MPKQMPPEYYQCLEELQAIDFVLVELSLYLNTHPKDLDAIRQFNETAKKSMQLKVEFEKKFGPLMNFGRSYSGHPWNVDDTPWPWQV